MTVGERLYYCRLERHMTQKELGALIGIDSATIGKYERGVLNPKLSTLHKIAGALGVSVLDLTGPMLENMERPAVREEFVELVLDEQKQQQEAWLAFCVQELRRYLLWMNEDGFEQLKTYAEFIAAQERFQSPFGKASAESQAAYDARNPHKNPQAAEQHPQPAPAEEDADAPGQA